MINAELDAFKSVWTLYKKNEKGGAQLEAYAATSYVDTVQPGDFCATLRNMFKQCGVFVTSEELYDLWVRLRGTETPEHYDDTFVNFDGQTLVIHEGDRWVVMNAQGTTESIESMIDALKHISITVNGCKESMDKLESLLADLKFDAFGTASDRIDFSGLSKTLPGVHFPIKECPDATCTSHGGVPFDSTVYWTVMHLNDTHRWPREQIADWLESIHDPTGKNGPNINFGVKSES